MSAPRHFVLLVALTVLYFAAGRFGLSLAFVNQSASAIWPPTGIAIAACLLGGTGIWPALLAGAFLVNLTTTQAVLPSLLIACGNTAEGVIAASLALRFGSARDLFAKTIGILAYVGAAAIATTIAATIGVAALLLGNLAAPSASPMIWLTWWTGDLSSALLVTPAIVAWAAGPRTEWTARGGIEAFVVLVTLLATSY